MIKYFNMQMALINPSPHCVVKNVTKNPKAQGVNEVIQSVLNLPH